MTSQTAKHVPSISCKSNSEEEEEENGKLITATSTIHEPVAIRRNVRLGDDKVEIDKDLNCFQ